MTEAKIPARWQKEYGLAKNEYCDALTVKLIEELGAAEAVIESLLTLEELDFGDVSLLPEDHPMALALTLAGRSPF